MNCAAIVVFWALVLVLPELRTFALVNLGVQLAIFVPIASMPGWRRRQISFVDIAWPTGLVAIGIQLAIFADRITPLTVLTAAFYVMVGARMATWATRIYRAGGLVEELPRYRYQRIRWAHEGFRSERFSIQFEITVQMLANASVLAMPAYLIATNSSSSLSPWEIACVVVALAAYAFESLADLQKSRFTGGYENTGTGICDVGLWRYSRHPNYFGQWVQWVALVGLALPSLAGLHDATDAVPMGRTARVPVDGRGGDVLHARPLHGRRPGRALQRAQAPRLRRLPGDREPVLPRAPATARDRRRPRRGDRAGTPRPELVIADDLTQSRSGASGRHWCGGSHNAQTRRPRLALDFPFAEPQIAHSGASSGETGTTCEPPVTR